MYFLLLITLCKCYKRKTQQVCVAVRQKELALNLLLLTSMFNYVTFRKKAVSNPFTPFARKVSSACVFFSSRKAFSQHLFPRVFSLKSAACTATMLICNHECNIKIASPTTVLFCVHCCLNFSTNSVLHCIYQLSQSTERRG